MKAITLCLLVVVSASCLLSTNANAVGPDVFFENLDVDFDLLDAELNGDYMDIEEYGFITWVRTALRKLVKTVRGVNCILKEVNAILKACTDYVDAIDACGTAVPKDVAAVVSSCKAIISICDSIINLNSKLCAAGDDADANAPSSKKCCWNVFKATMKLTRKINTTLKQIAKLPTDTSSCFLDSTNAVKQSFNDFLPNINTCVDQM
ncbi:uncharacterized protein LOC117782779 [Drosophila innubila]|uniref:uncharacterized protein LOC117782779 n=1 Tax=Drosophila innubila TaxID=198719 RepID=UPI00148BDFC3|nr:uncharacterized protein LOC117782779 [Drosophila innubila]